jgi:hypothetical protein
MGTDRCFGGWPFWPPKPRRSTLREHRLAEPGVYVPENLCRYGARGRIPPVERPGLGAPLCLLLLGAYALPVGVLLAIYAPDSDPPPTASESARTRDPEDPLNLVDRPEWVPVDRQPRDDEPEPPLEPEGDTR